MSTSRLFLGVRPPFYDVLSGEFTPPTDELNRAHTLARLMTATCLKGTDNYEDVTPYGSRPPRRLLGKVVRSSTYDPSWAPVRSVAIINPRGDSYIEGLHLEAYTSEDKLTIYDLTDAEKYGVRLVLNGAQPEDMPTEIGEELIEARQHITAVARTFFNRLARYPSKSS